MKTKISILFYLKRAKVNPKGLVPIFQRITVNGKRIDKSTGKYIDPLKWSVEGAKMKGTSEEARTVNSHLDVLKAKVLDAEKELTGNALNEFLLKKLGKTWDNVPEAVANFNDIDSESVKAFIKDAQKSGRMPDVSDLSIEELFEKLRLLENGEIKRAAIILFGKDPNRFYPNVMIKIGRFGSDDADLKFQETEEGNLFQLLKNVPNQLNYKFFTKSIDFEGMLRIEKGEYPVAAIREMLLNALVHRMYMGSMIQLRVYDNKLTLWNEGNLPEGMELESLKRHHISRPRNPIIADICFKAGYIDSWGRGTLKIINSCKEAGLPEPTITTLDGGILVTLFKDKYSTEQLKPLGLSERQIAAIEFVKENKK
nr:ATP-binding protein [uncultured Flavobacterium sp.]